MRRPPPCPRARSPPRRAARESRREPYPTSGPAQIGEERGGEVEGGGTGRERSDLGFPVPRDDQRAALRAVRPEPTASGGRGRRSFAASGGGDARFFFFLRRRGETSRLVSSKAMMILVGLGGGGVDQVDQARLWTLPQTATDDTLDTVASFPFLR